MTPSALYPREQARSRALETVGASNRGLQNDRLGILVVDDEPLIRKMLTAYLSTRYLVFSASSHQEALQHLGKSGARIHVVLSDINMPSGGGLSLLADIRQSYPDLCTIMISGSNEAETVQRALREGAFDYITKPIYKLDCITAIIERWQNRQSDNAN